MISEHEARAHVLARVHPVPTAAVPLDRAIGLVIAEPVVAAENVPPFANSAVDGYAVRAADTATVPVELPVVDEVAAGAHSGRVMAAGEAIRIMTGAPVPAGVDAIVMVEDTERLDDGARVRVLRSVAAGTAIRAAGDDISSGTVLYQAGDVITPAVAGVLASVDVRSPLVVRRVRVGVLSTGDELVDDGSVLLPGQIRESNKTMLLAAVTAAGCDAVDYGIVRDDEAALEATLRAAAGDCDAIVTSGGVSMGDYDVVKAVLSRIADMRWMQIAIKPAKPFAFGLLTASAAVVPVVAHPATGSVEPDPPVAAPRDVPVFGLPGNPVSSLVSFELFARPALLQMQGRTSVDRPRVVAVVDGSLGRRPDGKTHYQRVSAQFLADGRLHVTSVGAQGSHQLAATSMANAIAIVPDGDGVPDGGEVDVMLLTLG